MKFYDDVDLALFKLEVGRPLNEADTKDDHHLFIQRRSGPVSLVKDFIKSKRAEREWASNRWTHMQGIKDYQASFQAKKRHRQMGRFLATREPRSGVGSLIGGSLLESSIPETFLRGIDEALEYYHPLLIQAELEVLRESLASSISSSVNS